MKRHLVIAAAALGFAFVASGANAQNTQDECGFEHPKKAKQIQASLVQAFVSCGGNPGANPSNDATEGTPGTPSCSPPETRNDQAGGHPTGWMWDESKGQGKATFKAKNKTLSKDPIHASKNPPGDTGDIQVALKLQGVVDDAGVASGNGTMATLSRATLRDRRGTPGNNTDDDAMTVVDFPAPFPFTLTEGKANLKTSANVVLNGGGINGLPHCASVEVVDLSVNDENGTRFLSMGTFIPAK